MNTKTVLCVFGTRPEAIKMAPIVRALQRSGSLRAAVCATDQHQEMLDQVLDFFGIRPDYRLGVMGAGQAPAQVAARVLERLPGVLERLRPAALLVQGDTTTTVAAAMAGFYARIPVGHIEAGLRTYRKDAPFPEEGNRQMTTAVAEWHFAATDWARGNLLREGVLLERIVVTGNPVIDALHWTVDNLQTHGASLLPHLGGRRRFVLASGHRRESFGAPFLEVCAALRDLVERNPDIDLVYPVHLNPQVQAPVRRVLGDCPRIHLLPPLNYWHLVDLLRRCTLVLTDSGGIQEEAPAFGKPVLVMRDTTERPEGIAAGTALLVGTDHRRIVSEAERLLRDSAAYARMAMAHNPYGDGRAAQRIVRHLRKVLGVRAGRPVRPVVRVARMVPRPTAVRRTRGSGGAR